MMETNKPLFIAKAKWGRIILGTSLGILVLLIFPLIAGVTFDTIFSVYLAGALVLIYLFDWQFSLKHFLVYENKIVVQYPISFIMARNEISLSEITKIELIKSVYGHGNPYIKIHFKTGKKEKYNSASSSQLGELSDYLERFIKIERQKP